MTKKSSRTKATATPPPPSVDRPGDGLPAEVTNPPAGKTAAEKFNDWEEGKILDLLKDEFGGTGFVTLQRRHMSVAQGQWTNLAATIPVENLKNGGINLIASMFGGGDYRAKARPSNGQFSREFTFVIDHTIPPKNPLNPGDKKMEQPALDVPGLVREIRESMPKPDNSLLTTLLQQQTEMMKSALARPEPKTDNRVLEMLIERMEKSDARFEALLEKISEREEPKSFMEQVREAREVAEEFGAGGKSEKEAPWFAPVLAELAKNAGPLLKQFAGGAPVIPGAPQIAAAPSTVTAPPASASINATGTPETVETSEMNSMLNIAITSFRNSAIKAAKAAKDPYELVATSLGFVADNFPQYLVAIRATANSADWFNQIFAAHFEASKHLKFLTEVRDAVLLNAFVAHASSFAAQKKTAAETVEAFMGWVTPEFHDAWFNATDPENWALAFESAKLPESAPGADDGAELDLAWLGELRAAVIDALDLQETEAEPEQPAAGATPATSDANGAAGSIKPPRAKAGVAAGGKK